MKIRSVSFAAVAGSAVLLLGVPAIGHAAETVEFTGGYTSTWGGSASANINGAVSPGLISEDFTGVITSGEKWNAQSHVAEAGSVFSGDVAVGGAYVPSYSKIENLNPGPLNCLSVPEGGSAWMFLLFAGFSCFGAMFLKYRRETENHTVA